MSLRNRTNAPRAVVPASLGGHVNYAGAFVHSYGYLVPPSKYQVAKLSIIYVKLAQGPEIWRDNYEALIEEFETTARREGATFLSEGHHNLDGKLEGWGGGLPSLQ